MSKSKSPPEMRETCFSYVNSAFLDEFLTDIQGMKLQIQLLEKKCEVLVASQTKLCPRGGEQFYRDVGEIPKREVKNTRAEEWVEKIESFWDAMNSNLVYWYKGKNSGLSLLNSTDEVLSRLASGHLKCLSFFNGEKIFPPCPKCPQHQTSARHILNCFELQWEDIHSFVFDFLSVNGFTDIISLRQRCQR